MKTGIIDAIGNTPVVELTQVVPRGCARMLVKLEGHNPTGSMKDRMALAVVAGALRQRNDRIQIVAVEPSESPVLSGGAPGAHKIEGVGPGFIPPLWKANLADQIIPVSTAMRWQWPGAWLGKKPSSQAPRPAPMSPRRFKWPPAWEKVIRWLPWPVTAA
jgi:cysteine synthase